MVALLTGFGIALGLGHLFPIAEAAIPVPERVVSVRTEDGWELPMRAYPAEKGVEGRPPVLLVHGMSANHYNFDHEERVSLAVALQKKGLGCVGARAEGRSGRSAAAGYVRPRGHPLRF